MKSPAALLAVICVLAALGLGILAWNQQQELVRLRVTALEAGNSAELQKRIWDSEKRSHELEARLAAALAARGAEKTGGANSGAAAPDPAAKKATPSPVEILAFLNNPETQRALTAKFREQAEARYAGLFKTLNLTGPQLAQFKDLLLERQAAAFDVASAAVSQGIKPNEAEMRQLVGDAQGETDRKLAAALGPAAYAQFQTYESAQLFRGATTNLQEGLKRVEAPLTDEQAEQFTNNIATVAQSSFTPAQQQALRTLTQLQQTRQTLDQVQQLYKEQQQPKPAKQPGK